MVIETQQQYDDACAEIASIVLDKDSTDEQWERLRELIDATEDFENAKWGRDE